MDVIFPGIRDLGMNSLGALAVTGALRRGKCPFVLAVVAERGDRSAIAARRKGFQPQINADFAVAYRQIGNIDVEAHVPASACILDERSTFCGWR
jgi:hypothetical protein